MGEYSVLIVDDQLNWRETLEDILKKDFKVVTATNYGEALDKISKAKHPFHIVVTDMRLNDNESGNEDGLKLAEYIYTREGRTKAIIVTGYPTFDNIINAFSKYGIKDYLEKKPANRSFDRNRLLEVVRRAAEEVDISRKKPLAFVLMPFADEYKGFYEEAIKDIVKSTGADCKRVDDSHGPRIIMRDIFNYIKEANFILADFSGCNPNVCFETGIAHALGKNVIILSERLNDVPRLLQIIRCLVYERSLKGKDELAPNLEEAIREINNPDDPTFLIDKKDSAVIRKSILALVPNNEQGIETYQYLIQGMLKKSDFISERVNPIMALNEIWGRINSSEIIITDFSSQNADILYLTGLAYGLEKKIIYLTRDETNILSDLREEEVLVYKIHPFEDGIVAQKKLMERIKNKLAE